MDPTFLLFTYDTTTYPDYSLRLEWTGTQQRLADEVWKQKVETDR